MAHQKSLEDARADYRRCALDVIGRLDQEKDRWNLRGAIGGAVSGYLLIAMARVERDWSESLRDTYGDDTSDYDEQPGDSDEVKAAKKAVRDALAAMEAGGYQDAKSIFAEVSGAVADVAAQIISIGDLLWDKCAANQAAMDAVNGLAAECEIAEGANPDMPPFRLILPPPGTVAEGDPS
jgi:hypothetical protein